MRPNILTIAILPAAVAIVSICIADLLLRQDYIQRFKIDGSFATLTENGGGNEETSHTGSQTTSPSVHTSSGIVELLRVLIWPLTLILGLIFVAYNRRLGRVLGLGTQLIRKISAGGVEIEINSETLQLVQRELRGTFQELVDGSAEEYERLSLIQDIGEHLKNVVIENGLKDTQDMGATVHVSDVIFPEYLYQLVDYYPKGGGAHRRNSQRFGIIGRTWRTGKSHGTGNALSGYVSVDALVENWGMTEEEARGQLSGRPSSLSIVVKHEGIPVGIVFVDSTAKDAFGNDIEATEKSKKIEESTSVKGLAKALAAVLAPLRTAAPSLSILGKKG